MPWFAHAYRYERELHDAYAALGCLPPTYEPRATGHVPEMLELIQILIENGHAYAAADGSGDVYFDVRSWPAYGSLSRQRIDDMEPADDADPRGKRDPRDFALWKGHKPDEPVTASWPSPWGRGRPGWHLECSAMAASTSATSSTSTAAGSTCASRTTRTSWPSRPRPGRRSPGSGCTTHGHHGRGEDEQVARQRGAGLRGGAALPARAVWFYLVPPHYRSVDRVLRRVAGRGGRGVGPDRGLRRPGHRGGRRRRRRRSPTLRRGHGRRPGHARPRSP